MKLIPSLFALSFTLCAALPSLAEVTKSSLNDSIKTRIGTKVDKKTGDVTYKISGKWTTKSSATLACSPDASIYLDALGPYCYVQEDEDPTLY